VPKPIKLLEGIGNGGNGALIRGTAILWTNDQYFILLRSIGVYGKLSPVEHLRIYLCLCRRAPLYHPVLILACLTGVSGLVVNIGQWSVRLTVYKTVLPRSAQILRNLAAKSREMVLNKCRGPSTRRSL